MMVLQGKKVSNMANLREYSEEIESKMIFLNVLWKKKSTLTIHICIK